MRARRPAFFLNADFFGLAWAIPTCTFIRFRRAQFINREIFGKTRSAGVKSRVADKGRPPVAAGSGPPCDHRIDRIARRFGPPRPQRITADNREEPRAEIKRIEQLPAQRFELVGHHRQPDAALGQRVQHRLAAGVEAGVDRDIGLIMRQQRSVQLVEFCLGNAAGQLERALQHGPPAAADQVAYFGDGYGRTACLSQSVVHCRAKVGMRVKQGAVEVESDDIERKLSHGRSL